jgi:hypothetical protein
MSASLALMQINLQADVTPRAGAAGADISHLEAIGAMNFLDLDDRRPVASRRGRSS